MVKPRSVTKAPWKGRFNRSGHGMNPERPTEGLKGVVRVEHVQNPEDYISSILKRVKPKHVRKAYKIEEWSDHVDFLEKLARKSGKLLKKGEPDTSIVARMVFNDWQCGKLPSYVAPLEFKEPLSKQTLNIVENGTSESVEDTDDTEEKTRTGEKLVKLPLNVVRKLRKIKVALSYSNDDIKRDSPVNENNTDGQQEETDKDESLHLAEFFSCSDDSCKSQSELQTELKEPKKENVEQTDSISNGNETERSTLTGKDNLMQHAFDVIEKLKSSDNGKINLKVPSSSGSSTVSNMIHKNSKEIDEVETKLSSKQRRAAERSNQKKTLGSNFYEVSNVKNRNRNRKTPKIKRK